MPTHESEILRCARTIARLQTQRRKLKRQIKKIDEDLRLERRHMKALMGSDRRPDVVPSRLFGDGVGTVVPALDLELEALEQPMSELLIDGEDCSKD